MKVNEFLETKPLLSEFDTNILYYDNLNSKVNDLPASYIIGPVIYETQPLKEAMMVEAHNWKQTYGKGLANRVKLFCNTFIYFIYS